MKSIESLGARPHIAQRVYNHVKGATKFGKQSIGMCLAELLGVILNDDVVYCEHTRWGPLLSVIKEGFCADSAVWDHIRTIDMGARARRCMLVGTHMKNKTRDGNCRLCGYQPSEEWKEYLFRKTPVESSILF